MREIKPRNDNILFVQYLFFWKIKGKKKRHTLFRNERALFPLGRLVLKRKDKTK